MAAKKKKAGKKKAPKRQARTQQNEQADIPEPSLAEILEYDDGVDEPGPPPDEVDEPDDGLDDADSDVAVSSAGVDFDRDVAAQAARRRGLSRIRELEGESGVVESTGGEPTADTEDTPEVEHRVTSGLPEAPPDLERPPNDNLPVATLHLQGAVPVGQYGHSVQSSSQIDLREGEYQEDSFGVQLQLPQRNLLGQVVPGKPFRVRIPWSNVKGITDYMPRGGR